MSYLDEILVTISAVSAAIGVAVAAFSADREYPLPPEPREIGYGVVEGRMPTMPYPTPGAGTVWNETEEDR